MTDRKPCPVPGCARTIHAQELCCGPHWHPLTAAAKERWFHAASAHLRGATTAADLEAAARRCLGLDTATPEESR